ncbi:MAG TPA: NAD(P)-dependent oxidoreductase [Candidatus Solibacter sp.]|nr:NAD(P)-dependent oxidoreductase [Candidatus Solibacter sp.]
MRPADRVGFVGLGVMGLPMARNLRGAGFEVSGWARRPETSSSATAEGVTMRATLVELAAAAEILITMVTTSEDVVEVCLGAGGLVESARPGSVLVDMSTIAPDTSRRLAAAAAERGIAFLDAPVSGGSFGAEQATLTIMAGGDPAVLERCRPVFEAMGDPEHIFHTGPVGSGEVVKLVNNMLVGSISAATLEALIVGVAAGVSLKTLVEVVGVSSGASAQLSGQLAKRALVGELAPGFATDLLVKDLRLAADLASQTGQRTPVNDVARALFEAAQQAGHGRQDYTALAIELSRHLPEGLRL